jgi:hypothetical protein
MEIYHQLNPCQKGAKQLTRPIKSERNIDSGSIRFLIHQRNGLLMNIKPRSKQIQSFGSGYPNISGDESEGLTYVYTSPDILHSLIQDCCALTSLHMS